MKRRATKKQPSAAELREQVKHLSVDMEYSSREGNSAYTQLVNKKLDKLYNMLDRIASRGKKV